MHHHLPNRKRTLNLLLHITSGPGKICVLSNWAADSTSCGFSPSIPSSFHLAIILPPEPETFRFPLSCKTFVLLLRWYRLRREIQRFLIIFYPHTFALDQLDSPYLLPSLLLVLDGSSYFTYPHQILQIPNCHILHTICHTLLYCTTYSAMNAPIFSKWPSYTRGYELFNCSNVRESYQWWNYRGCWHHALPLIAFLGLCAS